MNKLTGSDLTQGIYYIKENLLTTEAHDVPQRIFPYLYNLAFRC